jgi:hypothetical protein
MEYLAVRTSEGYGVLHIVYRGPFIPVAWLRKQWFEIHRAFEVWIREVSDIQRIARYIVAQYLGKQLRFERFSTSQNWIIRGACRHWRELCKFGFENRIEFRVLLQWWSEMIVRFAYLESLGLSKQVRLDGIG